MTKDKNAEARLLQLVSDYMSGRFTINSEKSLLKEIISLTSPKLTEKDVFEVIFEGDIESPEEGVLALRKFAQSK